MSAEKDILAFIADNEAMLIGLERDIWEHPQVGFYEEYAAKLLSGVLRDAGFRVSMNVAQLPTAFVAEWGSGPPIIGILGEYDALPGMSQKVQSKKEPAKEGAAGHACGHNLLGVGGLGAALALKRTIEEGTAKGTVRYYGCPAEETLIGKVFMARDGVFDDLDAVLTWHPMYANTLWNSESTALNSFKFNFHGVSAHAAAAPQAGRSALDGVMLTDVGVNYLREHVIQDARIHCVITHGGDAPNIVPSYAQVWYYVRAPKRPQVEEIYRRVLNIANGADLMTDTTHDVEFLAACYDYLPNQVIGRVLLQHMKELGPPPFDDADLAFARELQSTLEQEQVEGTLRAYRKTREELGDPLSNSVVDEVGTFGRGEVLAGSTDVGDVSYITPTGQVTTCCMPLGVPVHSWQACAATGSGIGAKGMMLAAKTLALTGLDLLGKPEVLKAAREEFVKATSGKRYASPLPSNLEPPKS